MGLFNTSVIKVLILILQFVYEWPSFFDLNYFQHYEYVGIVEIFEQLGKN